MSNEQDEKSASPVAPQQWDAQSGSDEQSNSSSSFQAAEDNSAVSAEDESFLEAKATGVPVVGLGASAGGIEALAAFFNAMPIDSGPAFVVVLHLDPTKQSQLSSVLRPQTRMPVVEIEDGIGIRSDHVYVITPNHNLTLDGDTLRLSEPALWR